MIKFLLCIAIVSLATSHNLKVKDFTEMALEGPEKHVFGLIQEAFK